MNPQDRFDDLLTRRLRTDAPAEAPSHLLGRTMERIDATPQGGRGWLTGPAGKLLAAAAVVILAVLVGTQLGDLVDRPIGDDPSLSPLVVPSDSSQPTATVAPSISTAPIASTAPSASPGTPEPTESPVAVDDLLLRVVSAGGGPIDPASLMPWATLMADGTMIWQPESRTAINGFMTRRLTPSGLAELREHIFGAGLLDVSATHELEPQPGVEPPGRGASLHTFTAGNGADQVVVTSVQWLGDDEESTYYQPDADREQLDAVAQQLRDPESLVEADAWTGPAEPYDASDYQLILTTYRDFSPSEHPDVSDVPIPFDEPLDEFGVESGDQRPPMTRCGVISRAEAAQIVDAVTAMGSAITNSVGLDRPTLASLNWAAGNGTVDMYLLPRMPDGFPACEDQP